MEKIKYGDSLIKAVSIKPLWWQERNLMYTSTGYGGKIPSEYMVKCTDGKTRRIYTCIYGNSGSFYIIVKGQDYYINDYSRLETARNKYYQK